MGLYSNKLILVNQYLKFYAGDHFVTSLIVYFTGLYAHNKFKTLYILNRIQFFSVIGWKSVSEKFNDKGL